MLKIFVI